LAKIWWQTLLEKYLIIATLPGKWKKRDGALTLIFFQLPSFAQGRGAIMPGQQQANHPHALQGSQRWYRALLKTPEIGIQHSVLKHRWKLLSNLSRSK
jgi:hypothetical protein